MRVAIAGARSYMEGMKQSDIYRENAENCLRLAEIASDDPAYRRYLRLVQAWRALAREQDWLDGEVSPLELRAA